MTSMMTMRPLAGSLLTLLLAACSVAPTYRAPEMAGADAFKQTIPEAESAAWKRAEPAEGVSRGAWWQVFGDPALDALQAEAAQANPTLQAGLARLAQARALSGVAESARWPQLEAGAGATRLRASPASRGLPADAEVAPQTLVRAQLAASWEIDLFGRVANSVAAARADAERATDLYHALLLSIQADVAQTWFALRGIDAEIALLDETVSLREQALALLERRFKAGEIAELEVARSRTELSFARSERIALGRRRAEIEHALATLVGRAPAEMNLSAWPLAFTPVAVPAGLPSALLERRPDVAAAERAMAAANARIGVARAAWFPRLTLTGLLGLESAELSDLGKQASRTWALGPLAGTALNLTLFDGGRRRALQSNAEAQYEESAAEYRGRVLNALREVEDALVGVRSLARQSDEQRLSVESAERAAALSRSRYRAGYVGQLELIDAERQLLATRRAATQTERDRALATVQLIRALGGGWRGEGAAAVATEKTTS